MLELQREMKTEMGLPSASSLTKWSLQPGCVCTKKPGPSSRLLPQSQEPRHLGCVWLLSQEP